MTEIVIFVVFGAIGLLIGIWITFRTTAVYPESGWWAWSWSFIGVLVGIGLGWLINRGLKNLQGE